MVSLSTVYSVSIVLGSIAGMAVAFLGTKVYPVQSGGGDIQADIQTARESVQEVLQPAPEPLATETTTPIQSTEQTSEVTA